MQDTLTMAQYRKSSESTGVPAEGRASHPGNLGREGRRLPSSFFILVLYPATGPSLCAAPAYALHPAAGDRKADIFAAASFSAHLI